MHMFAYDCVPIKNLQGSWQDLAHKLLGLLTPKMKNKTKSLSFWKTNCDLYQRKCISYTDTMDEKNQSLINSYKSRDRKTFWKSSCHPYYPSNKRKFA